MMRQQRRISVGVPGGAPGGGARQRRISVTNKLGQTVVVSGTSQRRQSNVRSLARRSIVGGVRAPDGRRRSCVAVKKGGAGTGAGTGGGGGGFARRTSRRTSGAMMGGVMGADDLMRRREFQEKAARGRRASLLAQARGGGGGAQVAPFPPPSRQQIIQPQQSSGNNKLGGSNIQQRKASTGSCPDSDDDDELILAAVAFMNGEAPAPVPPQQPKTKKGTKKPKKKTRLSVKHAKKAAACKRLSDFSLMYDSYCNSMNLDNLDIDSDSEVESDSDSDNDDDEQPPPAAIPSAADAEAATHRAVTSAAEAYRLAMEREGAALAEAHRTAMRGTQQGDAFGDASSSNQSHAQRQQQQQPQPGRTSLDSRKEAPNNTNKKRNSIPSYEELEMVGIPAVQLTSETTVLSPELARHRARMAEAESNTQAMMEGMTLEQHKKLLKERFGGGSASDPSAEPAPQEAAPQEMPMSSELRRHRKRLEEAERATQANMEGMTLDQHKKLLKERFGKDEAATESAAATAAAKAPPKLTMTPQQAQPSPSATLLDTLEQAKATAANGGGGATETSPSLLTRAKASQVEANSSPIFSTEREQDEIKPREDQQRRDHNISLSRMDSRSDAVQAVGNRWRKSAGLLRCGEQSERFTVSASRRRMDSGISSKTSDDDAGRARSRNYSIDDAQTRAFRAVVRSRNSRRDDFDGGLFSSDGTADADGGERPSSSEDVFAMTNRLFEDIGAGIDEDQQVVAPDATRDSTPRASLSSSKNTADEHRGSSSSPEPEASPVADAIAALPASFAATSSRRKSSLNYFNSFSNDDESTSSLLSWGAAAAGNAGGEAPSAARRRRRQSRRLSDSASSSSLRMSIVSSSSSAMAAARRRRSSGAGAASIARHHHRVGGWEHPLGFADPLAFIGGLGGDFEWEKTSFARRRQRRRTETKCARGGGGGGKSEDGGSRDQDAGEGSTSYYADLAGNNKRKKKKKRVRFPRNDADGPPLSSVRDVPHLIDYSPLERSSAWRSRTDNESTRDDVLVAMMSLHNCDGIRCGRGLEALASDEEWELRRISRDFVAAAVLEEQRAQGLMAATATATGGGDDDGRRRMPAPDEEEIARASKARSAGSVEAALEVAAADEDFVRDHVRRALFDGERPPARGVFVADDGQQGGSCAAARSGRFGYSGAIPGLGLITQRLSAEKCRDKLSDGDLICDFQRQGRQFLSRLRRSPPEVSQVRSSTAA